MQSPTTRFDPRPGGQCCRKTARRWPWRDMPILTVGVLASIATVSGVLPPFLSESAWGQAASGSVEAGSGEEENAELDLAKKTQNPVADLISVPFQNNFDFGTGPGRPLRYTLDFQPVVPASLTEDWTLIARVIAPVIDQGASPGGQELSGLSDVTPTFFFSPKQPSNGITWGIGPVFLLPTATVSALGSRKFGLGPSAVVLRQDAGWTYGALVNHIWSVAGASSRKDVNATFIQPFLAYTFSTYTTVGISSEDSLDWTQRQWTAPILVNVSQILPIAGQPVSFGLSAKYFIDRPTGGPDFGLRFTVTLLFPK
jgi:hypothetical protein